MKEKTLVSTFTLIGSLASYYYAKTHSKDAVPFVMIGGFAGAWIGELVAKAIEANKNNEVNNNKKDNQNGD